MIFLLLRTFKVLLLLQRNSINRFRRRGKPWTENSMPVKVELIPKWYRVLNRRDVPSMIRATLLEVKFSMPSRNRESQYSYRWFNSLSTLTKWVDRVVDFACSLVKRIKKINLQSKEGIITRVITMGWPKGSNSYGHGSTIIPVNGSLYWAGNSATRGRVEVKLLSRKNYSGTGSTNNSVKKLDSLKKRCKEQHL